MQEVDTKLIKELFPFVTNEQLEQFKVLPNLYKDWNSKINVISRKDIDNIFTHHILYSLAIAKVFIFPDETKILDIGTGGGFPGLPLAILFPKANFHLIDRTAKKIKVVNAVTEAIKVKNIKAEQMDCKDDKEKYDFIVSRGVTNIRDFYNMSKKLILTKRNNNIQNGILYLKGDDVIEELSKVKYSYKIYDVSKYFSDEFFLTKKIVYIPIYK